MNPATYDIPIKSRMLPYKNHIYDSSTGIWKPPPPMPPMPPIATNMMQQQQQQQERKMASTITIAAASAKESNVVSASSGEVVVDGKQVPQLLCQEPSTGNISLPALSYVTDDQLRINDVLLGRGRPIVKYEGNMRFRSLIYEAKDEYNSSVKRSHKDRVARNLLDVITSRNGRFLRRVDDSDEIKLLDVPSFVEYVWIHVDIVIALDKIKQTFRDVARDGSHTLAHHDRVLQHRSQIQYNEDNDKKEDDGGTKEVLKNYGKNYCGRVPQDLDDRKTASTVGIGLPETSSESKHLERHLSDGTNVLQENQRHNNEVSNLFLIHQVQNQLVFDQQVQLLFLKQQEENFLQRRKQHLINALSLQQNVANSSDLLHRPTPSDRLVTGIGSQQILTAVKHYLSAALRSTVQTQPQANIPVDSHQMMQSFQLAPTSGSFDAPNAYGIPTSFDIRSKSQSSDESATLFPSNSQQQQYCHSTNVINQVIRSLNCNNSGRKLRSQRKDTPTPFLSNDVAKNNHFNNSVSHRPLLLNSINKKKTLNDTADMWKASFSDQQHSCHNNNALVTRATTMRNGDPMYVHAATGDRSGNLISHGTNNSTISVYVGNNAIVRKRKHGSNNILTLNEPDEEDITGNVDDIDLMTVNRATKRRLQK